MMLKILLLCLFFSQSAQANEPSQLAGDKLVTAGLWTASVTPPVTVAGSLLVMSGAFSGYNTQFSSGITMTMFGLAGNLASGPMMIHGNKKMIADLQSRGMKVDTRALSWSYGFTAAYIVSHTPFFFPELIFSGDSVIPLTLSAGFICYVGAIVSSRVQQKRSRRALQRIGGKQSFRRKPQRIVIRPVLGPRTAGLVGQF